MNNATSLFIDKSFTKYLSFIAMLPILLLATSCEPETVEEDPISKYRKCAETSNPILITKRGGLDGDPNFLHYFGDIYAEVLEGVDHIEVSTSQPAFGYLEGHTESYDVKSFTDEQKYFKGDTTFWKLPFVVNHTNTDYTFSVKYYCANEENPEEPKAKEANQVGYSPGDLCDDGGVFEGHEFITDILVNNAINPNPKITSDTFNVKFKTRIPEGGSGVELFMFPLDKITSSNIELLAKDGTKYTRPITLKWVTEEWKDNDTHLGEKSYLSTSTINLRDLFTKSQIEDSGSIAFKIKRCGKEYYKILELKL